MKFQIVEFNDAKENSKFFCVYMGKRIAPWWKFWTKQFVWEWVKEVSKAIEEEATKYETFAEALKIIEEIKKQQPIVYNIK